MYDIGLPSGRTLFQLIAERIRKVTSLCNALTLPLYIMTSPANHQMTLDYFTANNFFELGVDNVFLFQQGMLPCLTEEGKIIMETASRVSMAPDGNGGLYTSLQSSGAVANMRARGIEFLHVFSIDNALVKPADPVFVGYCIQQQADCGNKVVWKADPYEKVGVVALHNGKSRIVEYSEMTDEVASQMDDTGKLIYGAGNICNHFYTLDFVQDVILPNMGALYHIARKKIPFWNGRETVTPSDINGVKLETFIFDVFPLSKRMIVWEVERNEEFAPVKNAAGALSDSPDTARAMISNVAKDWLRKAGANLIGDEAAISEISPAISYAGEGLDEYQDKAISMPFVL
ncbi:hypothetical protein MPSEU_000901200 [Mayamaea pseudoterrestris]|nr:hypothetical protein MPSEU_000901200 [Mayamaea pseudoterrestris]